MSQLLKKEFKEGLRSYKFLIISFTFVFFALLDPLILKLLPTILKSQTGMEAISSLITINQTEAVKSYFGDVVQIIPIVIAFTISGVISKEYTGHYLDIPLTKGLNVKKMYIAKTGVYALIIVISTMLGLLVNYIYSAILFGADIPYNLLIKAIIAISLILINYLAIHFFIETFVRKAYLASIFSLVVYFSQFGLIQLLNEKYRIFFPQYLISQLNQMYSTFRFEELMCVVYTLLLSTLLFIVGQLIMGRKRVY